MKTFRCDFGKGTTCTIQVTEEPPTPGQPHIVSSEWTGKREPRVFRPYVAWINSVNTQLANEWGLRLMHVFLIGKNDAEVWAYIPGERPKRVYVGDIGKAGIPENTNRI